MTGGTSSTAVTGNSVEEAAPISIGMVALVEPPIEPVKSSVSRSSAVVAGRTATFSTPFIHLGLVPEAASSLLAPRVMGYQRAFAMLVMGRTVSAEEAREAGFVNAVVAPGHTEVEARKIAREIAALPKDAVALTRKLLKPAREDILRRMDEESHHFGERLKSDEARNAFRAFFERKKKA